MGGCAVAPVVQGGLHVASLCLGRRQLVPCLLRSRQGKGKTEKGKFVTDCKVRTYVRVFLFACVQTLLIAHAYAHAHTRTNLEQLLANLLLLGLHLLQC